MKKITILKGDFKRERCREAIQHLPMDIKYAAASDANGIPIVDIQRTGRGTEIRWEERSSSPYIYEKNIPYGENAEFNELSTEINTGKGKVFLQERPRTDNGKGTITWGEHKWRTFKIYEV
jgi:hypothetical protein